MPLRSSRRCAWWAWWGAIFHADDEVLLRSRNIDLEGLERASGRTFRWAGRYAADFNNRTTLDTQLNVFETFRPKLPPAYADSAFVFLANIDPVLQLEVLGQVRRPRFVACDTMNFWIGGKRSELVRVLERVNMVLLNDEEARQLSGKDNLPTAASVIRAMGPGAVVIKRGDAGALFFSEEGVFAAPAFRWRAWWIPPALAILSPVAAWAGWPAPAILHRLESARRWWWVRSWPRSA